jgi:hypothetical protein
MHDPRANLEFSSNKLFTHFDERTSHEPLGQASTNKDNLGSNSRSQRSDYVRHIQQCTHRLDELIARNIEC